MDYSKIRGFNYQPGYAATGLKIWAEFDERQVELEIARGKNLFPQMNALRIWLSFDAFIYNQDLFISNFNKITNICKQYKIMAMPVLFNNWHSIPDFGGVTAEQVRYWNDDSRCSVYTSYVDNVVGTHVDDDCILAWDLCNEPFNSGMEEVFVPWLERLYDQSKKLDARAPITIGVPPSMEALELVEPMYDVLSPHLYYTLGSGHTDQGSYKKLLDGVVKFAKDKGKPVFAGETGWGRSEDSERVETLKLELGELSKRKIGLFIHMLNHSLVADGHRPEYGYVSEVGFMGCIEEDGSLRKGHEIINDYWIGGRP